MTGYMTRRPESRGLCRITALAQVKRAAKSKVGPLPTDWPNKIIFSGLVP